MKTPANFTWICRCFRLSAISYRKWNLKQSKIYILAFAARSLRAFQNLSVKLCIYLWFPLIKFISNVQKLIFKQEFPGIQLGYQGLTSGIQNWKLVASRILGYRQSRTLHDRLMHNEPQCTVYYFRYCIYISMVLLYVRGGKSIGFPEIFLSWEFCRKYFNILR
jgi:hypothetical protein